MCIALTIGARDLREVLPASDVEVVVQVDRAVQVYESMSDAVGTMSSLARLSSSVTVRASNERVVASLIFGSLPATGPDGDVGVFL